MPCGRPSTARISLSPATPNFDVLYALRPGNFSTPRTPESEERLTMTPPPRGIIARKAARQQRKVPRRLTPSTSSQIAASMRSKGTRATAPAEFTRMSGGAKAAAVRAKRSATLCPRDTPVDTASARPPAASMVAALAARAARLREARTTAAPSAANSAATARPTPRLAPVTIATLPASAPCGGRACGGCCDDVMRPLTPGYAGGVACSALAAHHRRSVCAIEDHFFDMILYCVYGRFFLARATAQPLSPFPPGR